MISSAETTNSASVSRSRQLVTDGIYNAGVNPLSVSENYNVPIYTIGMGDTNQYADLRIQKTKTISTASINALIESNF